MANVYVSGITWALTSEDIIELLKDSNSVFYKTFAGFINATTEIARQNALMQLIDAILKCEAEHPRRAVSVDVDSQEYPAKQLPSDVVKVSENVQGAENFLVTVLNNLMRAFNSNMAAFLGARKMQLEQFNTTMGPQHKLTPKQQVALSKSYENIVEQAHKALPPELKTEIKDDKKAELKRVENVEKLVKSRAAVGLELELMFSLNQLKPSDIKQMVKMYKAYIGQYIAAEQENYQRMQEIRHIEIEITAIRMTRGLVRGIAVAQNDLNPEESSMLSRAKNPFQTRFVPPVK